MIFLAHSERLSQHREVGEFITSTLVLTQPHMSTKILTALTQSRGFRTVSLFTGNLTAKPIAPRLPRARPPSASEPSPRSEIAPLSTMTGPAGSVPASQTKFLNGKGINEAVEWKQMPHPDWQPGQKQPNPWGSETTVRMDPITTDYAQIGYNTFLSVWYQ